MLQIGFATRDFTPTRPALIQGQKRVRIGEHALDPLTVTAFVAADGVEHAVIVSCDLSYPSEPLPDLALACSFGLHNLARCHPG